MQVADMVFIYLCFYIYLPNMYLCFSFWSISQVY